MKNRVIKGLNALISMEEESKALTRKALLNKYVYNKLNTEEEQKEIEEYKKELETIAKSIKTLQLLKEIVTL